MQIDYMKKAITLAKKGIGFVNPNPLVGALIVKNGQIIGEGYHQAYGGPHAEVNAFLDAKEDVEGADMYVTLEPCAHFGKTPPCALKIIEKKIKRVFIGALDPNPLVNGMGVQMLKDAGIEVVSGIMEQDIIKQNEIFMHYIKDKMPFVAIKYAMTMDGKIATYTKDSKWITNEKSRAFVHELRHRYMAIMVGIQTVIQDDPMLNTRREHMISRDPIRIIIDKDGMIPIQSKVVQTASIQPTWVVLGKHVSSETKHLLKHHHVKVIEMDANPHIHLNDLMLYLGNEKVDSILIEGGSGLLGSAIDYQIVHKAYMFMAPKLIGGKDALSPIGGEGISSMKQAHHLKKTTLYQFDDDIMIEGYLK
jgi:diaminohydroxyphosphoribosylaminopyrimidine deaminase / 5-amino-6-(5-phosphoribosylamino)uracil reductase